MRFLQMQCAWKQKTSSKRCGKLRADEPFISDRLAGGRTSLWSCEALKMPQAHRDRPKGRQRKYSVRSCRSAANAVDPAATFASALAALYGFANLCPHFGRG